MAWANIDLEATTPGHPKIAKLASLLGSKAKAMGHLTLLWCWAARYSESGAIEGDVEYFERHELDWQGTPGDLIKAMVEARLIDRRAGGKRGVRYLVHNWKARGERIHEHRALQKAKAKQRWANAKAKLLSPQQPTPMPRHDQLDAAGNTHGNAPILPILPILPIPPSLPSSAASAAAQHETSTIDHWQRLTAKTLTPQDTQVIETLQLRYIQPAVIDAMNTAHTRGKGLAYVKAILANSNPASVERTTHPEGWTRLENGKYFDAQGNQLPTPRQKNR